MSTVRDTLFSLADGEYQVFMAGLLPTLDADSLIGVRTPMLRKMAVQMANDPQREAFLADLPHRYFEENQLHVFLLCGQKNFDVCMREVEAFLPYLDNWASCDQLSPKVFAKHTDELLIPIRRWLQSDLPYVRRFGLENLMRHFLGEKFRPEYLEWMQETRLDDYYVQMMAAWFMAEALAQQWDTAISFLKAGTLNPWVHNKAIQKAVESRKLTEEQKNLLRSMRITKSRKGQ